MSSPVWEKITSNGRPFGYKEEGELEALRKLDVVEKENEELRKENERLVKLLEKKKK